MRRNVYPETFLGKIVYHEKEKTYYRIDHLPKRYRNTSETHSGEYFTRVTRLTNNEDKDSSDTVLHINPNTIEHMKLMKSKKNSKLEIKIYKDNSYYNENLVEHTALTKDFNEYIYDIHYGIHKKE